MEQLVRRIVTGHNALGKSVILLDEAAHRITSHPDRPGRGLTELWVTDSAPASNEGSDDPTEHPVELEPPNKGTIFRFFQVAPESQSAHLSPEEREEITARAFEAMGAAHTRVNTSRHPAMHKTSTVDYIVLLSGEVTMLVDEGEVDMNPGDVVVQRGTNHAWVNRTEQPAVLVAVLVDAEPA